MELEQTIENAVHPRELPNDAFYHVVALSNFAKGFDKYSRRYDKSRIPESTFSDKFFVLNRDEIEIGIHKVSGFVDRLGIAGNQLLLLQTTVDPRNLKPNTRTGLGQYLEQSWITVSNVFVLNSAPDALGTTWKKTSFESAVNGSLKLLYGDHPKWDSLEPRSVSVLPIALGCQAQCEFCFSHSSISVEQKHEDIDFATVEKCLSVAQQQGASRAVITGGGEPGLLEFEKLASLVGLCRQYFGKVVLISNGYSLAKLDEPNRRARLRRLHDSGLTVLALSRHHHIGSRNQSIMQLDTQSHLVAESWAAIQEKVEALTLRWICVLQRNGISNSEEVYQYVKWAADTGVQQVCFKELYVSTSSESYYHDSRYNDWSRENQVSLNEVLEFAKQHHYQELFQLPWGAPVFQGATNGRVMDIAAYTEPSVYWELNNGICRSWNLMADGNCFASLEDRKSLVRLV